MPNLYEVLTDREVEVLRLASSGKRDRQVAEELNVSTSTITTYWYRIKMKLLVHSRSEAIALYASQHAAPSEGDGERADVITRKAGSRQWSELDAPFVSFIIDDSGRFRQGSGSVAKYVGSGGTSPSDYQWERFIAQTVGPDGLRQLKSKGKYKARVEVGERTFDVYALASPHSATKHTTFTVAAIDISSHLSFINKLKQERDYFKSVLDQAPNMYFIWDFNLGAVTYANPYAHHALGLNADRLRALGWSVFDLVHPDDRDNAMARISQIAHMRPGDIQNLPLRVKTLEGKYMSWNTVATPYSYNDDGSVREFLCACFDIAPYHDDLALLQEENRRLVERYEGICLALRHAPVGLMIVDLAGRVVNANPEGIRAIHADRDGWQDIYSTEAPPLIGEKNRLQLGRDWLEAIARSHRTTTFQIADLRDYLGNRRKFVLSVRVIRNAQGDISSYCIAFYDHAEIEVMDGRTIENIRPEVPNGPEP